MLFLFILLGTSILSSLFGAWVGCFGFGVSYCEVYRNWFIGTSASLAGLLPFFLLILTSKDRSFAVNQSQLGWTIIGMLAILSVVVFSISVDQTVRGFFLCVLIYSWMSLRQGRVGSILSTAILLILLSFASFAKRELIPVADALNLGSDMTVFATLFFSIVLPGNVIAALIGRLQSEEFRQRDLSVMKTELISTLSHEIKTPLNAIHGILELFNRSDLPDKQKAWSEAGLSASRTLQSQFQQILEMARLGENKIVLDSTTIDRSSQLQTWVVEAEALVIAQQKDIRIIGMTAKEYGPVFTSPEPLNQIVLNPINNAIKFSTGGVVSISAKVHRNTFSIDVKDDGVGIERNDHERIFRRFSQVSQGDARLKDGVGLGLAISRDLARQMGGDITVESNLGRGSTFRVVLPSG